MSGASGPQCRTGAGGGPGEGRPGASTRRRTSGQNGMRLPLKVSGLAREAVHEVLQVVHIVGEHGGGRAVGLLVQLGRGFVSLGPRDGSPGRRPLQENAGIRNGDGARRFQAHVQPESIGQVTDHLVRGHLPPAARSGGVDGLKAGEEFGFVFGIEECLYGKYADAGILNSIAKMCKIAQF
jgi:hypothetical protein